MGSLPLQPAGLLGPLPGPLSENHVFQVTLHTSLQLHGRTAELPWSDFNRRVICHARHTVRYLGALRCYSFLAAEAHKILFHVFSKFIAMNQRPSKTLRAGEIRVQWVFNGVG